MVSSKFAGRGLHSVKVWIRLDDKAHANLDSFKINPTYNTDGIVKFEPFIRTRPSGQLNLDTQILPTYRDWQKP